MTTSRSTTITACRSCESKNLLSFLDLGETPLSDRLVDADAENEPEPTFPLQVAFCPACSLVQILETVDPELLFTGDYPYYSSFSDAFVAHARANALELIEQRELDSRSLCVELASNDGYLLQNFVAAGIPVLGIDPAPGPVEAARAKGVETLQEFFTADLAMRLRDDGKRADVILGNNVLAHVADTNGFVAGVRTLLSSSGVGVFEFPYVRDLIEKTEFDTIYHEHLCYFSATAIRALFERHGLYLNDVRRLPIHGGSLRIYVEPRPDPSPAVTALLAEERALCMDDFGHYEMFAERVLELKHELRLALQGIKLNGERIAAYGAAAKGATLLNFFEIDASMIDFVVDRNVHKHGKFMPGVRIPIRSPEALLTEMPDCVLLLTWNFQKEILAQQAEYRARGGRFLIPIPKPVFV